MLRHVYETLEERVGMRLAYAMDEKDLDEFEAYFEAKDNDGAFAWLSEHFPNYREVVKEEFDRLQSEIRQMAPMILAKSGIVG